MKSFLIYGCGRSGVAAINLMWNKKDVFYLFDKDPKKQKEMYDLYKERKNVFVLSRVENDLIKNEVTRYGIFKKTARSPTNKNPLSSNR